MVDVRPESGSRWRSGAPRTPETADGQPPPHDLGAEATTLAACLQDREALDTVFATVAAEDFYAERHARIFRAAQEVYSKGNPVDWVTVAGRLRTKSELESCGGSEYLGDIIASSPAVARIDRYTTRIRELARLRKVIATMQRLAVEGYFTAAEPQEYFDHVEAEIHALMQNTTARKSITVGQAAQGVMRRMAESIQAGKTMRGASTGFPGLDDLILGLRPSMLHILAARPSVGKSSLALNIAMHMARHQKGHVAFFSQEMMADELAIRAMSSEANVDATDIIGIKLSPDASSRLQESVRTLTGMPIHIFDEPAATMFYIAAESRRIQSEAAKAGEHLALIAIDYLQLVKGLRQKGDNRQEEVAGIALDGKRLAGELKVPVLALSQLNRAVESRGGDSSRPRVSDLRESGAIENHADVVALLHRAQRRYAGRVETYHECIVGKARGGKTGVVNLNFQGEYTRFTESTTQRHEANEQDDD